MSEIPPSHPSNATVAWSRRRFLKLALGAGGAALLAGCASTPPAAPAGGAAAPAQPAAAAPTQAAAAAPAPASAPAPAAKAQAIRVRISHPGSEKHAFQEWSLAFKKVAEQKSGGALDVQIFPNGSLGNELQNIESLRMGSLEIAMPGAPMSQFVPSRDVVALPFLFRNEDHFFKSLEGPIQEDVVPKLEKQGMKLLSHAYIGVRHTTNNKRPINTPDDMKGLKMRVPNSKAWIEMMKALGGTVVPIDLTELYSALKQGVADGQENPLTTIMSENLFEVQKYLSLTSHMYSSIFAVSALKFFQGLSPQLQDACMAGAHEGQVAARAYTDKQMKDGIDFLKGKGMAVNEPPSLDPFMKATANVPDTLKDTIPPDLVDKIRKLP